MAHFLGRVDAPLRGWVPAKAGTAEEGDFGL